MCKNPLVTIVIPSYNHSCFIEESILSVIDQDYDNIELIIIDDGSSDASVDVINKLIPACKLRFNRFEFRCRPNKGVCATLNEALDWAKGEYFSPLASDDIALKHKISFLINKISKTKHKMAFGLVNVFGNSNSESKVNFKYKHTFESIFTRVRTPAAPASIMLTKAVLEVGGFNKEVLSEDVYIYLRLTEDNSFFYTYPEVVTNYRLHDTNTINNLVPMHNDRFKLLQRYSGHKLYKQAINGIIKIYIASCNRVGLSNLSAKELYIYRFYKNQVVDYFKLLSLDGVIAIYGHGTIFNLVKDDVRYDVVYDLFNKNATCLGGIKNKEFDFIVVTTFGQENDIIDFLLKKEIDENKIITLNLNYFIQ